MVLVENKIITDFFEATFYDKYVILKVFENIIVGKKEANIIQNKYKEHYGTKEFVVISDRRLKHDIDLNIYKHGLIKNIKGIAIVSNHPEELERAMLQQKYFKYSFALYPNLEDAIAWAESFFG